MSRRYTRLLSLSISPILMALASGCHDSTAPSDHITCPAAGALVCIQPEIAKPVTEATSDASTRSSSALQNKPSATAISQELNSLVVALSAGDIGAARSALKRASDQVASAKQQLSAYPGDAPDLTAIELALIQVDKAIR